MNKDKKNSTSAIEDDAKEMLKSLGENQVPEEIKEKLNRGKKLQNYLDKKKRSFKDTKYRKKYDAILDYIDKNLVNTETYQAAMKSQATQVAYSFVYENGSFTQIPILSKNNANELAARIPISKEPVAFSKITTAVSVLAGKIPDATVVSSDKIYSRSVYELWKRTWSNPLANGMNTLQNFYFNVLATGFGAYRVFPRRISHEANGVPRILYDDIYRQTIDPRRFWVGSSVNIYDRWSKGECLYEVDQDAKTFLEKYEDAEYFQLEYASTVQESGIDSTQAQDFVTIRYYENPITNKYCVACGNYPIYEGEMPNAEGFGHVVWANCFSNNPSDPYGVGIVELIRGNTEMYDYISRLSAEQVEAEISPLLFGTNTGVGEMTYRRGPNVINPKGQGTAIDVIKTSGNVQQSLIFADSQKQKIADNTGINDILAGSAGEGTLGATVIMKEAALSRLIIPRNNVISCLEEDAYMAVSWIEQTYSVDKIIKFNSSEEVNIFIKQNPEYFVYKLEVKDEMADPLSIAYDTHEEYEMPEKKSKKKKKQMEYGYSKRIALNFNIVMDDEKGEDDDEIEELTDDYTVPASKFFEVLKTRGHLCDRLQFIIDPTSMLLPSEEINKQRLTQIYEMVTPATAQILQLEQQMPDLARTMLVQLENVLDINKQSIFKWFPKDVYDRIMKSAGQQPITPAQMIGAESSPNGGPLGLTEMPQPMMNQPGAIGPMTQEFNSTMGAKTGSSMNSALDASIGRAAKANLQ